MSFFILVRVAATRCLDAIFISLLIVFVAVRSLFPVTAIRSSKRIVVSIAYHCDLFSFFLVGLVLINLWSCNLSINTLTVNAGPRLPLLLIALAGVSVLFFLQSCWLKFYIFFELRLVPILLIIIGWGYQIERVKASKAIIIYTVRASLPLLALLLTLREAGADYIEQFNIWLTHSRLAKTTSFMAAGAFLVKLPIIFVHIWLPKAHVEAPVIGSMFLAAILLKLGGIGVVKIKPLLEATQLWDLFFYSTSLWALVVIRRLCIQATDIKVLIAFSSVAHIAVVVLALCRFRRAGAESSALILLSHGISSSMAFFFRFLFYKNSHSRNLLLNKRAQVTWGRATVIWVLCCLGVIGAPPTFNLWVEIIAFVSIILASSTSIKFLFWRALLTGAYCFILVSSPLRSNCQFNFAQKEPVRQIDMIHLSYSRLLLVIITFVTAAVILYICVVFNF